MQGVITRRGVTEELSRITTPTLILVGEEDVATTPEMAELLHARIQGSRLMKLPHVGHMSNLEEPERVNQALQGFLTQVVSPVAQ
jgi:pimeloyl-ACP methyl ester carboxylesterase